MTADLYTLLEVDRNASPDDLKKSYRRLARQLHPDANPGDAQAEARFKEVSQAYEILSDPERRSNYDRFGHAGDAFGGGGGFGGGSVQDLFDMFFSNMGGPSPRRSGPLPGPDMETSIDITLNDASTGVRRDVVITLPVSCPDCHGLGAAAGTSVETCGECQGIGEVRRVKQSILGQMITSSACPRCNGVGTIVVTPCETCRGEGRTTVKQTLTLDVPAGVENGSTMRLSNRGPAGLRGGPNGTLFVHIRVAHDPRFERQGDDLHTQIVIRYPQAVLGTEIEIPTLEGPEVIDVPAGSKHGTVLRLKGRGVTHLRGRGVGDLYVHVSIDVPSDVSDAERDLLRQLAELQGVKTNDDSAGAKLFRRGKSK